MRRFCWCWLLLLVCGSGCTHLRLQRSTVDQGSTLNAMREKLVLDNLAMFACNASAIAWHVRITGGVAQVSDQGSGVVTGSVLGRGELVPGLGFQRNVLDQWNLETIVEADDLELLNIAYRKAIHPFDPDGSIRRDAFKKIGEISTEFHIVLTQEIAIEMIEAQRHEASEARRAKLDHIQEQLVTLYGKLDQESSTVEAFDPQAMFQNGVRVPSEIEFVREEIIKLMGALCDEPFIPRRTPFRNERNIGLIEQAQGKIAALIELVGASPETPNAFSSPWIGQGCKADVPCNACYVGRYRGCEGECYIWVLPGHGDAWRDFNLLLLDLVPPDEQDFAPQAAGVGAAFNPNF